MIFLPLYFSLLSLINSQLLLTIAHPTIKIVVSVQPVVQSRKTHLNYKSFSKIKIYEFCHQSFTWKELANQKEKFQRLFQPVCGQERSHIDLINLNIVSSAESGNYFFKSADESVENSTSQIDGRHSVPAFPKVNNLCSNTYWNEIQCNICCCYN